MKNKLVGENKDKYLSLKEKSVLKIEEYDQTIEKKKEESSILRDELKMLEEDIISEESAISTINAALADVINEWKQFCISDIPNKEMSKKEINRLQVGEEYIYLFIYLKMHKVSLFVDDMILYISNDKNSTREPLQLINTLNEVSGSKINSKNQ